MGNGTRIITKSPEETQRFLWEAVRRALLAIVRAIEKVYNIGSDE